jgi:hypothetical protein
MVMDGTVRHSVVASHAATAQRNNRAPLISGIGSAFCRFAATERCFGGFTAQDKGSLKVLKPA